MNSKRNVLALAFASIALLGMGCGGLGASGSLSPASFLLPGISHHEQKPLPVETVDQPTSLQAASQPVASAQVAAISADLVP